MTLSSMVLEPSRAGQSELSGVGLGLRWDFLDEVLESPTLDVAFFEVSPENYMRRGGYYPAMLEQLSERYAFVTHGLTMSLGAIDAPPGEYLDELSRETRRLATPWHSDHLCFSTAGPLMLHDLLPLKLAEENVHRVAERLRRVQDHLGLPMLFENISYYAHPGRPEMPETEFIQRIVDESGCGLLLDVNNVYVNSKNHQFDARQFIAELPLDRVAQLHVAGHNEAKWDQSLIIDTHGAPVITEVMELLSFTVERTGPLPVLLERDNEVPPLADLMAEVQLLRRHYELGLERWGAHAESA